MRVGVLDPTGGARDLTEPPRCWNRSARSRPRRQGQGLRLADSPPPTPSPPSATLDPAAVSWLVAGTPGRRTVLARPGRRRTKHHTGSRIPTNPAHSTCPRNRISPRCTTSCGASVLGTSSAGRARWRPSSRATPCRSRAPSRGCSRTRSRSRTGTTNSRRRRWRSTPAASSGEPTASSRATSRTRTTSGSTTTSRRTATSSSDASTTRGCRRRTTSPSANCGGAVVTRKIGGCNRTDEHARAHAIIASVAQTAHRNGHTLTDFVRDWMRIRPPPPPGMLPEMPLHLLRRSSASAPMFVLQ